MSTDNSPGGRPGHRADKPSDDDDGHTVDPDGGGGATGDGPGFRADKPSDDDVAGHGFPPKKAGGEGHNR